MDYAINFPHLGIYLSHVGKSIQIGPVSIAFYGIMIALGMTLGIFALMARARETGQNPDDYLEISLITMAAAIVGARIYYVIFSWDYYGANPGAIFNLREGGLAIYGGLIAGSAAVIFLAKWKKIPFPRVLDTCVIGVPIGQIIGRWGNFFNREAFGAYTDNLFAMQLPVSAVRQNEISQEMWDHVVIQNGIRFIQVHPTFLYEGLWNCGVLLLLFLVRNRTKFEGELFLIYLAGYGTGRFFIEMLRTDQLLLPGTRVPVSMLLSAVLVAASVGVIIFKRVKKKKET